MKWKTCPSCDGAKFAPSIRDPQISLICSECGGHGGYNALEVYERIATELRETATRLTRAAEKLEGEDTSKSALNAHLNTLAALEGLEGIAAATEYLSNGMETVAEFQIDTMATFAQRLERHEKTRERRTGLKALELGAGIYLVPDAPATSKYPDPFEHPKAKA